MIINDIMRNFQLFLWKFIFIIISPSGGAVGPAFKSFCSVKTQAEDTVRKILSCSVEKSAEDVVTIRITLPFASENIYSQSFRIIYEIHKLLRSQIPITYLNLNSALNIMNQRLPEDIVVQDSSEVPLQFHPRKCYSEKTYVTPRSNPLLW